MKLKPSNLESQQADGTFPTKEEAASRRAWELLGHASKHTISGDFADRIVAASATTPQDARPSVVVKFVRVGLPLAAAATLMFSLTGNLFGPTGAGTMADARGSAADSAADLTELARMDAALSLLPESPDLTDLDPAVFELASLDDPSQVTDEQLLGLLY